MYHGGERNPVRYAQLGEHVPEVGVHGVRRDVQPPGHGTVRQSPGHQQRHRPLGRGEALPAARRPVPGPARARTDAQGPQLRPDPACPGIGARLLVAFQCLSQQRRWLVPPPAVRVYTSLRWRLEAQRTYLPAAELATARRPSRKPTLCRRGVPRAQGVIVKTCGSVGLLPGSQMPPHLAVLPLFGGGEPGGSGDGG
jgi:hypothetical protein